MQVEKTFTYEMIFDKLSPIEIYQFYYTYGQLKVNRLNRNPFVSKDENPSMLLSNRDGELIFKCFNSDNRGNSVSFVMQMFGISYSEAIDKIATDFGFKEKNNKKYQQIISELPKIIIEKPKRYILQMIPSSYQKRHIEYLKQYYLEPIDFFEAFDDVSINPVKKWYINKNLQTLSEDEIAFGYNLHNERGDWLKLYFPEREKRYKWKSSIPFTEMMGLTNLHNCSLGVVTKSVKDAVFIRKYITPCVALVQAEDITAFSKENIEYINQNCKNVYVAFDNDKTGISACKAITTQTGWGYINPPRRLIEDGETDFSGMGKVWSIESVKEHFNKKLKI